jgi:hypothetical protein
MSDNGKNLTWVQQMLFNLLNSKDNMPMVIVTHMDAALINIVAIIFLETTAILCHFYIRKNVRAKCITDYIVKPKDVKVDGKIRKSRM